MGGQKRLAALFRRGGRRLTFYGLRGHRQPVGLPAQDEMEDDQRENANYSDHRATIDQKNKGRY